MAFGLRQFDLLHAHYGYIPDDDLKKIFAESVFYKEIKKGEVLVEEGGRMDYVIYLISGSVKFYSVHNGTQRVTRLLGEGNFVTSVTSFLNDKPADVNIKTLEKCRVLMIKKTSFQAVLVSPVAEKYKRFLTLIYEETLDFQRRISQMLLHGGQRKIDFIFEEFPGIFQRFSMRNIASFAGIEPETLSRIRRKMVEDRMEKK